jgi:hypothetical protein
MHSFSQKTWREECIGRGGLRHFLEDTVKMDQMGIVYDCVNWMNVWSGFILLMIVSSYRLLWTHFYERGIRSCFFTNWMTIIFARVFFHGKAGSHHKGDITVPRWWLWGGARPWWGAECISAWPQHWDVSHCASQHMSHGKQYSQPYVFELQINCTVDHTLWASN